MLQKIFNTEALNIEPLINAKLNFGRLILSLR
jgi:hypothetical protein